MQAQCDGESLWSIMWSAADLSVRARLGVAVLAALLGGGLSAAAPIALNLLVDAVAMRSTSLEAAGLVALYAGALCAARFTEQLQTYAYATGDQRFQQRLSLLTVSRVLRLPLAFHIETQAGSLMQTLSLGLQGVRTLMTHIVLSFLPLIVQLAIALAVLVRVFDAGLAITVVLGIAAYAIVFSAGARRLASSTRDLSASQLASSGLLADALANMEAVKAAGAEGVVERRYAAMAGEAEHRWRGFHARRTESGTAAAIVLAGLLGLALTQAFMAVAEGRLSPGGFVLLNAYILQLVRPVEMAGFAARDLGQAAVYIGVWANVLRRRPETYGDPTHVQEEDAAPPEICFDAVSFRYAPDREVLSGVSFIVPAGKTLALIGVSGAGKSSLIRLLLRHHDPDAGCIRIDGAPIKDAGVAALRARIAVVSQETVLFNAPLRDNLMLARPDATDAMLADAIRVACLGGVIARLPAGLDTVVGERGLKLSGGERQRVAIARAILKDAPILILDEPSSALDPLTEQAVLAGVSEGRRKTILVVTHRLDLAANADRIVLLDQGYVVEAGSHQDLVARGGAYARLWRLHRMTDNAGSSS